MISETEYVVQEKSYVNMDQETPYVNIENMNDGDNFQEYEQSDNYIDISKRRKKEDEDKMEEILDIVPFISGQDTTTPEQELICHEDKETGEKSMVAGWGTRIGEDLYQRLEKIRKNLRLSEEEYKELRKMWAKTTLREIGIAVPATEQDELNPEINVVDGKITEDGPTIRIKYILPDPRNEEHHREFMRQKASKMYSRQGTSGIYSPKTEKTAATKGDRIPYGVDMIQYNICYGIKNVKKLVVDGEVLDRLNPLTQESIRELIRNGCSLPCVIKTPWLLRLFDHNPKPLTMSSVNLMHFYYLLSSYILPTIFPSMGKAIDRTKRIYEDDTTGRTKVSSSLENEENAYMKDWTIEKVLDYIKKYQSLTDRRKKTIRKLNLRMGMNDLKIRSWAYYQQSCSYSNEMRCFYENVVKLILEYANYMEIDENNILDKEDDSDTIKVMRFAKQVSRNELFLHDYWILLQIHTYNLISIQEMFILVQCYTVIPLVHIKEKGSTPIDVWGELRTIPNVDPSRPFHSSTFSLSQNIGVSPPSPEIHPAHICLFSSIEILEKTMYEYYEREIWQQTKNIIGDYEQFMGRDRDIFINIKDESPRLYGGRSLLTVPTMFQLQRSVMFVTYMIQKTDAETLRNEIKQIYSENVKKQIEHAKKRGERIKMITRYGEEISSYEEKKRERMDQ